MSDFNSSTSILQPSHQEYVNIETIDPTGSQMSTAINSNVVYNSTPILVLNSPKSDINMLQGAVINDGTAYMTFQSNANNTGDINGTKLLNAPIIIQSAQTLPFQTSQYQSQCTDKVNIQNNVQVAPLTQSQLQSLSYLMQAPINPQFIQTSNGLIQIIPQSLLTTQNASLGTTQSQDNSIQGQIATLPGFGWSLNNFANNGISFDNQAQISGIAFPHLIPVQQIIQPNNLTFINNQNDDNSQIVSNIIDLNNTEDQQKPNKKGVRRKRKTITAANNKSTNDNSQLSSPLAHPTSTNEVTKEPAESSSGKTNNCIIGDELSVTQYDNKGRPFSFFCSECPKKFTLNSRLSAHMRCHTGMRPFTCNVCGFSFTQKSYLIRHAAVHKEERPFTCEKCQKSYKHYGSLANHRKLHRKDDKNIISNIKIESTTPTIAYIDGKNPISINESPLNVNSNNHIKTTIISEDVNDTNNLFSVTSTVHSTTDLYSIVTSQNSDIDTKSDSSYFPNNQQMLTNDSINYKDIKPDSENPSANCFTSNENMSSYLV